MDDEFNFFPGETSKNCLKQVIIQCRKLCFAKVLNRIENGTCREEFLNDMYEDGAVTNTEDEEVPLTKIKANNKKKKGKQNIYSKKTNSPNEDQEKRSLRRRHDNIVYDENLLIALNISSQEMREMGFMTPRRSQRSVSKSPVRNKLPKRKRKAFVAEPANESQESFSDELAAFGRGEIPPTLLCSPKKMSRVTTAETSKQRIVENREASSEQMSSGELESESECKSTDDSVYSPYRKKYNRIRTYSRQCKKQATTKSAKTSEKAKKQSKIPKKTSTSTSLLAPGKPTVEVLPTEVNISYPNAAFVPAAAEEPVTEIDDLIDDFDLRPYPNDLPVPTVKVIIPITNSKTTLSTTSVQMDAPFKMHSVDKSNKKVLLLDADMSSWARFKNQKIVYRNPAGDTQEVSCNLHKFKSLMCLDKDKSLAALEQLIAGQEILSGPEKLSKLIDNSHNTEVKKRGRKAKVIDPLPSKVEKNRSRFNTAYSREVPDITMEARERIATVTSSQNTVVLKKDEHETQFMCLVNGQWVFLNGFPIPKINNNINNIVHIENTQQTAYPNEPSQSDLVVNGILEPKALITPMDVSQNDTERELAYSYEAPPEMHPLLYEDPDPPTTCVFDASEDNLDKPLDLTAASNRGQSGGMGSAFNLDLMLNEGQSEGEQQGTRKISLEEYKQRTNFMEFLDTNAEMLVDNLYRDMPDLECDNLIEPMVDTTTKEKQSDKEPIDEINSTEELIEFGLRSVEAQNGHNSPEWDCNDFMSMVDCNNPITKDINEDKSSKTLIKENMKIKKTSQGRTVEIIEVVTLPATSEYALATRECAELSEPPIELFTQQTPDEMDNSEAISQLNGHEDEINNSENILDSHKQIHVESKIETRHEDKEKELEDEDEEANEDDDVISLCASECGSFIDDAPIDAIDFGSAFGSSKVVKVTREVSIEDKPCPPKTVPPLKIKLKKNGDAECVRNEPCDEELSPKPTECISEQNGSILSKCSSDQNSSILPKSKLELEKIKVTMSAVTNSSVVEEVPPKKKYEPIKIMLNVNNNGEPESRVLTKTDALPQPVIKTTSDSLFNGVTVAPDLSKFRIPKKQESPPPLVNPANTIAFHSTSDLVLENSHAPIPTPARITRRTLSMCGNQVQGVKRNAAGSQVLATPARIGCFRRNSLSQATDTINMVYQIYGRICSALLLREPCIDPNCLHMLMSDVDMKKRLVSLSEGTLNKAFDLARRHLPIFSEYFPVFCEIYVERNDPNKLLSMIAACEMFRSKCGFIWHIYQSLLKCGWNKTNAVKRILSNISPDSILMRCPSSMDAFMDMFMDSDVTKFLDQIEKFAQQPQYQFDMKWVSPMAVVCNQLMSDRMSTVVMMCLQKVDTNQAAACQSADIINFLQNVQNKAFV